MMIGDEYLMFVLSRVLVFVRATMVWREVE